MEEEDHDEVIKFTKEYLGKIIKLFELIEHFDDN